MEKCFFWGGGRFLRGQKIGGTFITQYLCGFLAFCSRQPNVFQLEIPTLEHLKGQCLCGFREFCSRKPNMFQILMNIPRNKYYNIIYINNFITRIRNGYNTRVDIAFMKLIIYNKATAGFLTNSYFLPKGGVKNEKKNSDS